MLVGESASNALEDQDEKEIKLGVLGGKSVAQWAKKLCAPDGSTRAAENAPVGFGDVDAGWALVVRGAFDSVRVSSSGQMTVGDFCDEDLGALSWSVERLCGDVPVDGLEGSLGPVVSFHEFLAEAWTVCCLSKPLGESSGDGFSVDCKTGFGSWNKWDERRWN